MDDKSKGNDDDIDLPAKSWKRIVRERALRFRVNDSSKLEYLLNDQSYRTKYFKTTEDLTGYIHLKYSNSSKSAINCDKPPTNKKFADKVTLSDKISEAKKLRRKRYKARRKERKAFSPLSNRPSNPSETKKLRKKRYRARRKIRLQNCKDGILSGIQENKQTYYAHCPNSTGDTTRSLFQNKGNTKIEMYSNSSNDSTTMANLDVTLVNEDLSERRNDQISSTESLEETSSSNDSKSVLEISKDVDCFETCIEPNTEIQDLFCDKNSEVYLSLFLLLWYFYG